MRQIKVLFILQSDDPFKVFSDLKSTMNYLLYRGFTVIFQQIPKEGYTYHGRLTAFLKKNNPDVCFIEEVPDHDYAMEFKDYKFSITKRFIKRKIISKVEAIKNGLVFDNSSVCWF